MTSARVNGAILTGPAVRSDAAVFYAFRWSPLMAPRSAPDGEAGGAVVSGSADYRARWTRVSSNTGSADS